MNDDVTDRREEIEKQIKPITTKLLSLAVKLPDSSTFLGNDLYYPRQKRRLFGRFKRPQNLKTIRDDVTKPKNASQITAARNSIRDLLKKYPYCPDLRVLNGVQMFYDVTQSGVPEKKIDILGSALKEIAQAMHNGCLSLYNTTWLERVYIRYLETLRYRMTSEISSTQDHYHWQVKKAVAQVQQAHMKLGSLILVKDKLGGINMLNKRFKGTDYTTDCITKKEIEAACLASKKDLSLDIGNQKTAGHVLLIVITSSLLLARIPLMESLVTEILGSIPEVSRDLILQKTMIGTMLLVTRYQLSVAAGEKGESAKAANQIYMRSVNAIKNYAPRRILSDPHEIDPFLKAAWIAKESRTLLDQSEFEARLRHTLQLLKIVLRNPKEVKGAVPLAIQLRNDIQLIMNDYGWSYN